MFDCITGLETLEPTFETWSAFLYAAKFSPAPAISWFISAYLSLNSCRLIRDRWETAFPGMRDFWASWAEAPYACYGTVHLSSFNTAESKSILIECRASVKLIFPALENPFFKRACSASARSTPCNFRIVKKASSLTTPVFSRKVWIKSWVKLQKFKLDQQTEIMN